MGDGTPSASATRRSVVAATVLVGGQLALSALIGWLVVVDAAAGREPAPPGAGASPPATVRRPVAGNAACAPESALGRTAGGTPVRCERDDRRRLRWRRV